MQHTDRAWALVTDGHRARVVVPDEAEGRFRTKLVLGVAEPPYYPVGVSCEGACGPLRLLVADLAGRLNESADHDLFDELILVGPTQVVHDIRAMLSDKALARMVGTLTTDETPSDDAALSALLAHWWSPPRGAADLSGLLAAAAPQD